MISRKTPSDRKEEGRVSSGCDSGSRVEVIRGRGLGRMRRAERPSHPTRIPPTLLPPSPWSDSIPGVDGHKFAPAEAGFVAHLQQVATWYVKMRTGCHDWRCSSSCPLA